MFKPPLITMVLAMSSACGGGGGSEEETGFTFLRDVPSEQVLCSFVVGETTEAEVLGVLALLPETRIPRRRGQGQGSRESLGQGESVGGGRATAKPLRQFLACHRLS